MDVTRYSLSQARRKNIVYMLVISNPAGRLPLSPRCSLEVERVFCLHCEAWRGFVRRFLLWGTQFHFGEQQSFIARWLTTRQTLRRYGTVQHNGMPYHTISYHTVPYIFPWGHLLTSLHYREIISTTETNTEISIALIHIIKKHIEIGEGLKLDFFFVVHEGTMILCPNPNSLNKCPLF